MILNWTLRVDGPSQPTHRFTIHPSQTSHNIRFCLVSTITAPSKRNAIRTQHARDACTDLQVAKVVIWWRGDVQQHLLSVYMVAIAIELFWASFTRCAFANCIVGVVVYMPHRCHMAAIWLERLICWAARNGQVNMKCNMKCNMKWCRNKLYVRYTCMDKM